MAAVKLSDEALLAFFQSHPGFRDRVALIMGAVGNLDGDLGLADASQKDKRKGKTLSWREAKISLALAANPPANLNRPEVSTKVAA